MISAFETMVRTNPDGVFFTFVDAEGRETRYTYRRARMLAAAMALRLRGKGVREGDCVAVDLPNSPAFVLLALAAAYGSFSLVALNYRLTASEKLSRLLDLEHAGGVRIACRVDVDRAQRLMHNAHAYLSGGAQRESGRRAIRGAREDSEEEVAHFAERASHLFDPCAPALVMFTSGTTGKAKATLLTWENLMGSAESANKVLSPSGHCLWQAALPLFHIGGFQVMVRSVQACAPFRLYERFDAARVLADVPLCGATHVSVVDKMLQDMLALDERGDILRLYRCILLGGGALNFSTIERARAVSARVHASYGMTETSSQIANSLIGPGFDGGMKLLPGYSARIIDPAADGFGRLAVRGPGVFSRYLNARAPFTVDGFFLTGDTAALVAGRIFVKERTSDMFVSGGENVYPAEIADALMRLPEVADAHVIGVPDKTWGRRPVAFVERARGAFSQVAGASSSSSPSGGAGSARGGTVCATRFGDAVRAQAAQSLSKLYVPQQVFALDAFPRTGIGKIDRAALQKLYDERLDVKRAAFYRVRVPFRSPFSTAKTTLTHRESIIVEVTDHTGRTGLGECVAFETDWYLPETLSHDVAVLKQVLAPQVIAEQYLHPREVSASFSSNRDVAAFPLACGALEPALWDLYGKITKQPLWRLLQQEYELLGGQAPGENAQRGAQARVFAGAVVGLGSVEETVCAVRRCVEAGYRRVKLKASPGSLEAVRAVRKAFPDLLVTLDANQSFDAHSSRELRELDELGVALVEEPIDLSSRAGRARHAFSRLAELQHFIATPVCLDESFTCAQEAHRALLYPELRCFAVKVAKFGGVEPALEFIAAARARGREVWMGGMYDTGISKRLHAAFQMLPDLVIPGDIGAVSRYFGVDIATPPYTADGGVVTLNRPGFEYGLGCELHGPALESALVEKIVVE